MKTNRYYIYEILENGSVKKAFNSDFDSKEEAEKSILKYMHPLDRKRYFALKVQLF